MLSIGLINPGAMGASVGAAAAGNGHRVLWASDGRSADTRERAEKAGLVDAGAIEELAQEAEIILSVCPPASAADVAGEIIGHGFKGLYVDANAISPARTREIAAMVTNAGARFVDGGIIGGPAWKRESGTVLHLAGEDAAEVAALFEGSPLHTNVVSGDVGAASALKMTYAAYTKGTTALLTAILALAEKEGVRSQLERQWGEEFANQTARRVTANTAKAWRFVGEMQEIASTFDSAGLPPGFHEAAAEIYHRLRIFKDVHSPSLDDVLSQLLSPDEEK